MEGGIAISDNDVYLMIVDETVAKLDENKPKTIDDAYKIMQNIEYEMQDRLSLALNEILIDYCDERGLVDDE